MNDKNESQENKPNNESNTIWGGRFKSGPDKIMEAINISIGFDQRLFLQDIEGSKAHCNMLEKQGIITKEAHEEIISGLETIAEEMSVGQFKFKNVLEDIHLNIEGRLRELIGENAGRLHTARSRNDQVATDLRLWVRDQSDALDKEIQNLQSALINQANKHVDWI
ncbi:MAG: lyase family protein, partial [Pseudomonadota bacterium]|nr:lyase family protein [Pseudomonadota bacterium]